MASHSQNLNEAVFTTTFVVEKGKPIVYVSHDEGDGAWQFLSAEMADMAEVMILALSEIIEMDPTVTEVLNMPYGHHAIRKDKNSEWVIISKN